MQQVGNPSPGTYLAAMLLLVCSVAIPAAAAEPSLEQSRALAQSFGVKLKTELQTAMADGGPLEAIAVCRDRAPQIAAELSRESGARVGRTSRRVRNPANAAELWQIAILEKFESDIANENASLEYFGHHADGARYMKAIQVQPLCLVCHGTDLADDVTAAIDEAYPHDRARGYTIDDLRGRSVLSGHRRRTMEVEARLTIHPTKRLPEIGLPGGGARNGYYRSACSPDAN